YTGAWGLMFRSFVLSLLLVGAGASGGIGFDPTSLGAGGGMLVMLVYLMIALYGISLILLIVGASMSISTPGSYGERALAITGLAMSGLSFVFLLLLFFSPARLMIFVIPVL